MKTEPTTRPTPGDRIEFDGQTATVTVCHVGNAYTVQFPDGSTAAIAMGADTRILPQVAQKVAYEGSSRKTVSDSRKAGLCAIGIYQDAELEATVSGLEAGW